MRRLAERGKGRSRHPQRLGQGVGGLLRTEIGEERLACGLSGEAPSGAHEQQLAEALGAWPSPRARAYILESYRERTEQVGPQDGHATIMGVTGFSDHACIMSSAARLRTCRSREITVLVRGTQIHFHTFQSMLTRAPWRSDATTPSSTCKTRRPSVAVMDGSRSSAIARANSSSSGTSIIVMLSSSICGRITVG